MMLRAFGMAWWMAVPLLVTGQTMRWYEPSPSSHLVLVRGEGTWSLGEAVEFAQSTHEGRVVMALNAGMFHEDGTPVGLFVSEGEVSVPLNLESGHRGNFFLLPNGVFGQSKEGEFQVLESAEAAHVNWQLATQSGPMLLLDGSPHPAFTPGSQNLRIRNGVGIMRDGRVLFGISEDVISFYDFAMAFAQKGCTDALYLDGGISRIFVATDESPDRAGTFSGVLVVLEKDE
jgi:uncharacterized protein YigE (DUF2233 family)